MNELILREVGTLSAQDLADLRWAHARLERPSVAARLCEVIGTPLQHGLRPLPEPVHRGMRRITELSIRKALHFAIDSRTQVPLGRGNAQVHKMLVTGTGAMGGFLGPLTLLIELPVTTTLMLRSIADIAEHEGENLDSAEARHACLEVFALGGRSAQDRAADTGYYGLRVALGFHFSSALINTARPAMANIPAGVELVRAIASRFGVAVSESLAAKLIPVAGAISGALLNLVFMQHFQDIARGHFVLRRLERAHGIGVVRSEYEKLTQHETLPGNAYYRADLR